MQDKKFFGWLWAIRLTLIHQLQYNENIKLAADYWHPLYEEGLNALQAIRVSEFGAQIPE